MIGKLMLDKIVLKIVQALVLFLLLMQVGYSSELQRNGWNLMSICQDISKDDINMTGIEEIQNQDGKSIYTEDFTSFSNLDKLEAGYGYWVKGNRGNLFSSGNALEHLEKPLRRSGWSLMGVCEEIPKSDVTMSRFTELQNQDGLSIYTGSFESSSNLFQLDNGYGYWVKGEKGTLFESNKGLKIPSEFAFETVNNKGQSIERFYGDYRIKLLSDMNISVNPQANHIAVAVKVKDENIALFQIQSDYASGNLLVAIYNNENQLVSLSQIVSAIENTVIIINDDITMSKSFITTWKTDNTGYNKDSKTDQITIPTKKGLTYHYSVDWGDGTTSTNVKGDITHTYENIGTYTVKINGEFPSIYFGDELDSSGYFKRKDNKKLLSIEQWGTNNWLSMEGSFNGCINMLGNASDTPNLSNVKRMGGMFAETSFNQDIGDWDVSSVTSMEAMFSESSFNQSLERWDVSAVTNMNSMFKQSSFNQDIGDWNISSVTDMGNMFNNVKLSTSNYNSMLNQWSKLSLQKGIFFDGGLSEYTSDASMARQSIMENFDWYIQDGGLEQDTIAPNRPTLTQSSILSEVSKPTFSIEVNGEVGAKVYINGIEVATIGENGKVFVTLYLDVRSNNFDITLKDAQNNESEALSFTIINTNVSKEPFIITWKTDNRGVSTDNQITIPTIGSGYNYSVDWGDGHTDTNVTKNITHTYEATGVYSVKISGDFPRIYFNNEGDKEKLLSIKQWGTNKWISMENSFFGCSNLKVNTLDKPNISNVKNMYLMFAGTSFNQDIGDWNVSSVTNMLGMFAGTPFNKDIGNWDVSNVEDMSEMFYLTSFNQDIGNWDVSNVTNMAYMFEKSDFNQDIGNWNVSNVENMSEMFYLTPFNQDIGSWDVSNVKSMAYMFYVGSFQQDIGEWNVSSVTDMSYMFQQTPFNQDIDNWDVSNVKNMNAMFYLTPFNQDIGNWDVSQVTNMNLMFSKTSFNQDIGNWNVSHVENLNAIFYSTPFNQYIGDWNVSSVLDMSHLFGKTPFNQDIGEWDVSSVKNMYAMFSEAPFNHDLNNWDVSSVTNMDFLFSKTAFNQDIGNWDVASVKTMYGMFRETVFDQNIGSWDISSVTNMGYMFSKVTLSTLNYSNILNEWSQLSLQSNVSFHGGSSQYNAEAEASRKSMIENFNWRIFDGGLETEEGKVVSDKSMKEEMPNIEGFLENEPLLVSEKEVSTVFKVQ